MIPCLSGSRVVTPIETGSRMVLARDWRVILVHTEFQF